MLRGDPLLAALDRGLHVLVEKPISVGVPEARVMAAAAEAATPVTACCFNWRYAPAYQTAQKAIRSGQIGAIRDMRTEGYFRTRSPIFRDAHGVRGWTSPTGPWVKACPTTSTRLDTSVDKNL